MSNFNTSIPARKSRVTGSRWVILFILTLGFSTGWKSVNAVNPSENPPPQVKTLLAQNAPQNAPAQLKTLITQIDASANRSDIKGVMNFYSPSFAHGDGLNRSSMEKAITSLWKRYPGLKYSTKLQSWSTQGNSIIADTVTNIIALPSANNKLGMNATIKSRQRIVGGQIIRQDILSEKTQITSGVNPPKVDINLPDQLKVGENYYFDAIVNEPLGDDFLLGTALDETVQAGKYANPTSVDLELLSAGGIFKVGRAPAKPGSQWISAVVVRGSGTTMITQRVPVVGK